MVVVLAAAAASAFEIPKASGKALGVTKGKPFDAGLVFVNGKFILPPYVVERWGNGIRINGTPVISQVVDWTEFLKTQSGVKVTKSESTAEEAPAEAAAEAEPVQEEASSSDDSESALDDLFDDEPKAKKPAASAPKASTWKPTPVAKKPTTSVSYSLEGDFVANDASRALVKRVNGVRTDIDRTLRSGGFIFFGDRYSRVAGDRRTTEQMIEKIPEFMQRSESFEDFSSKVHGANLVYLTHNVCEDLFRNRVDYRVLQERRSKMRNDREWKKLMDGLGNDGPRLSY